MIYEMFVNECEDGALGGFYITSKGLPKFLRELREKGFLPVGVVIDDEDDNIVEVVLAKNKVLLDHLSKAKEQGNESRDN